MVKKKFPLYVDIQKKHILVVGAGKIAQRRVASLVEFCDHIQVISPNITPVLLEYVHKGQVTWVQKEFDETDIRNADFVLATTNDQNVNEEIYQICKNNQIPVNISSNQEMCDFQFPGLIQYENVVIAFNSGGEDHKKVKKVRQQVEMFLKGQKSNEENCNRK